MTIRVDAFEEGPSVMMQKRERDERKDRERRRRDEDGGPEGEAGGEEA
jgi:small subunit ribosomal protein S6